MPSSYVNTVPDGAIGTGNAQVFGANPVAAQFGNQLGALREKQQLEAEAVAKRMRDNQLKISSGLLWAPEMVALEKGIIDEGVALQQRKIDPYGTSPEALAFRQKQAEVEAKQGFRKAFEDRAKDTDKYIRDHLDELDPEDIQANQDFYDKTSLEDAYNKNLTPSQLRKRFNDEDVLKPLRARTSKSDVTTSEGARTVDEVLDKGGTENVIIGAYTSDPRGREQLLKVTGGLDPREVQKFSPTYAGNLAEAQAEVEGDPKLRVELAKKNILPNTPEMQEYLSDKANTETEAYKRLNNWLAPRVNRISSGVQEASQDIAPKEDKMTEFQRQSIALRRQSESRQAAASAGSSDNAETPRDVNISYKGGKANVNAKDYVGLSIPAKSLVGLPTYDLTSGSRTEKLKPSVDAKVVGVANFPIISKGDLKGQVAQPKFEKDHPDRVGSEAMVHIKELDAAGVYKDKLIPYSALPANVKNSKAVKEALANFKPAGIGQTQSKSTSMSQIKALIGKSGYEGYTEKELIDYYKSQGYTIK